ncbi:hypothetical protein ACFO8O_03065 [Hephaestia sp. GCM10023244]|uniref:hypothetical protein n=1 Tax=unclassified Hephaestia TaxID=2631281 RepID=UPI0020777E5F|nr:hypothetical protein [Hephaestia sp. MAHUQ-44]MCM8729949.1 hypothetical protein [Hephaestia sp. MAHUQ-44]
MARARPPLFSARPSRFAGLDRHSARLLLAIAAIVAAIALALSTSSSLPAPKHIDSGHRQTDAALYRAIVEGVRNGGNYYDVAAEALRAGNYPLRPFVAFRLPTLAVVEAALPRFGDLLLLFVLAAITAAAWLARLRIALPRPGPLAAAMILIAGGLIAFVQPPLVVFHEIWAGLLIALALGLRRPGRWLDAVAFGLIAMLVRETALLFVLVMGAMALIEGRIREAFGWAATVIVFAVVVAVHIHAVGLVVHPGDLTSPGWQGMMGLGFVLESISVSTALAVLPIWLSGALLLVALIGWAGWDDPLATRTLATLLVYALLIGLFARADNFYWGLMIAPTALIGLAFAPDAIRDIIVAARDTRRITVTRIR